MKDLLKDNKVVLVLILAVALGLRLWELHSPKGIWCDEYIKYSISMLKFPFDFFDGIKTNAYAPLHYYYLKFWMAVFKNSDFMLKLSSLAPNLLGCFVMYKVGKNYVTKNSSTQIGLVCACISAISSFLIYFSQEARIYSLIFPLSALILLYSIKMYEAPSKKNMGWLLVFSCLLILEHTIGFVYVLFNMFGLIAFQVQGKKKKQDDYFIAALAMIILALPLIPFLLKLFAHPSWSSRWWLPFNWSNVCYMISDFFSPVLKNVSIPIGSFYHQIFKGDAINIGFVLFCLIPSAIALVLIVKSNIESKKINKYFLSVFVATFLTILITSIAGRINFLTKYLVELYPLLIIMAAIGFCNLTSKNTKIMIATTYVFIHLFYIIATALTSINLL